MLDGMLLRRVTALILGILLAPALVIAGCGGERAAGPSDLPSQAALGAVGRAVDAATSALNNGDVEAFVALHTEDAVVLKPGDPPQTGLAAMRSSLQDLFETYGVEESRTVEETRIAGEWAFVWGTYQTALTPKEGGETLQEAGGYIDILRRGPQGEWKFARTIWNRGLPAGGSGAAD